MLFKNNFRLQNKHLYYRKFAYMTITSKHSRCNCLSYYYYYLILVWFQSVMLSVIYNVCDKVAINTQKVGLYVLVQMSHQGAVLMCVCVCVIIWSIVSPWSCSVYTSSLVLHLVSLYHSCLTFHVKRWKQFCSWQRFPIKVIWASCISTTNNTMQCDHLQIISSIWRWEKSFQTVSTV